MSVDYEKLESEWQQTAQLSNQYLRSVGSIAGRLTKATVPGLEQDLALLQLKHLRTLEVLMAALWKNQATLERIAHKLAAKPGALDVGNQYELLAVRLKAILLDARYEDVPALEAHVALWSQLLLTAPALKSGP